MALRKQNGQFKQGVSGNPKGKPKGAKNKFTGLKQAFVDAFEEGGKEALAKLRDSDPKAFFELFRDLYPRESKATVNQDVKSHITHEDTGLQATLALAEEATIPTNARPLPQSGTD